MTGRHGGQIPVNRENNREFPPSGLPDGQFREITQFESTACRPIPVAAKPGIFSG